MSGGVNHSQISKGRESVLPTIRKPAPQSLVMVTPVPLPPTPHPAPPVPMEGRQSKLSEGQALLSFFLEN